MIALRKVYGEELVKIGEEYPNVVVLDADLSKSTMTTMFQKRFPDRFFDMGVAEQDLMATAAGLSTVGIIPFASTFSIFAAGRAWEQVRNSIAYNNLNVKIVATHAGITVGEDGASHQATEDISLMRVLPNMRVISPADKYEAKWAFWEVLKHKGPFYIRLGRNPVPDIYGSLVEEKELKLGKAVLLKTGKDIAIFSTGYMVSKSLLAAEILEKDGISTLVASFHTIKPIDKEFINNVAKEVSVIITVEEHNIYGGFGSAVKEALDRCDISFLMIGLYDTFGQSGAAEELLDFYGLSASKIADKIRRFISKNI